MSPDFTDDENRYASSTMSDGKSGESALSTKRNTDSKQFLHDDSSGLLNRINTRKWAAENGYDPKILFRKVCFRISFVREYNINLARNI